MFFYNIVQDFSQQYLSKYMKTSYTLMLQKEKTKNVKPLTKLAGQRHVTNICGKYQSKLDGDMLLSFLS